MTVLSCGEAMGRIPFSNRKRRVKKSSQDLYPWYFLEGWQWNNSGNVRGLFSSSDDASLATLSNSCFPTSPNHPSLSMPRQLLLKELVRNSPQTFNTFFNILFISGSWKTAYPEDVPIGQS